MKNKSIRNIVLLSLTGVMSLGIIIANPKTGVIPEKDLTALKAETSTGKFYSDYATQADCEVAAEAVDEQVAEESMVLLKNKDNLLPFKGVKRITVFGKNSINPSGTGTNSPFSSGTALEKMDIYDGLEGAGYTVNPAMKAFYEDNARSGEGRGSGSMFGGSSGTYISETPASDYDASVTGSFHLYGDAAIIQITRVAGEGQDSDTYNVKDHASDADNTNHYLQLSQNEKDMVALAEKYFDKIVFVINSPMAMQIGELKDDDKIGAILWAGIPGTVGFMAVGKILDGEVNPSGHLVDTWARDFTKDPTFQNFGDNQQSNSGNENYGVRGTDGAEIQVTSSGWGGVTKAVIPALEYEEGIYIGYRYYETMDAHPEKLPVSTDWYREECRLSFRIRPLSLYFFRRPAVESGLELLDKNGTAVASDSIPLGKIRGQSQSHQYRQSRWQACR
jgi:beta-glucosidase